MLQLDTSTVRRTVWLHFVHRTLLTLALAAAGGAIPAAAQDAAGYFRANCISCHTIGGGRLAGPDLKNVTQRKDREWLVRFLQSPQDMILRSDPYALKLQEEARGVVMPTVQGMSPGRAELLLTMIEAESRLPKSQFAGMQISDRPFTPQDIASGRDIFTGRRRLANGGPPCISCHTFNQAGAFGGGRLGPDLSKVYERLQGRKNMGAWLSAPATPAMSSTFRNAALKPEEILPLIALFENAARAGGEDGRGGLAGFFAAGFGLSAILLALLGAAWRSRLRAVRQPLVAASERRILGDLT
jgi:mono/diheme cytochrome c family protein